MLRGDLVALRARQESDFPVFHAELYEDVATRALADTRPWRPVAPDSPDSPYRPGQTDSAACFSIVELRAGELAGESLLWGIDRHNRMAHIGLSLRPAFRSRGLGVDCVRVLCRYGFDFLGLHRLQIETLAGNAAMIGAASRAGFQREGTLRRSAWVNGEFADEVVFGLLDTEWRVGGRHGLGG